MKLLIYTTTLSAILLGAGYWSYTNLQNKLLIANETIQATTTALSAAEKALDTLEENQTKLEKTIETLNSDFATIKQNSKILEDKLEGNDLNDLAYNKPELIQKLINRGTDNAFRCLELLSGAPLNNREVEATDAKDFNSECPWLFNTYSLQ